MKTEADIIKLIGYETPLKFVFTSEGTFTYETVIPTAHLMTYEVTFFMENRQHPQFFAYDSFSTSLLPFQIMSVNQVNGMEGTVTEIFFRKYGD